MDGFYNKGICVSEDISVIVFDDLENSQYLTSGLTTIRQKRSLKGQKAVEMLLEIIGNPNLSRNEELLSLHLVERGSVQLIADLESRQGKWR
ncbi:MAG TPA: substrate-binding domain-containing protein [Clostridiaceae bacterium]|nr:substrate-binding domain-containing protein [Clostridiaceae bacterium]